jgi:cytochrome d ubiquinol oxidase subunit II
MAFFTNFNVGKHVGLLDWYTVSIGVFAVVILAAHGAVYLTLKTDGPVHDRSAAFAKKLWLAAIPLLLIVTAGTWYVRPEHFTNAFSNPVCWVGGAIVAGAAVALATGIRSGNEMRAFVGSNVLIAAILATGAATIFPTMLFSTIDPKDSLSAFEVASSPNTLLSALYWWPLGFTLTVLYWAVVAWYYRGKVSVRPDPPEHHAPGK